jgi:hypothetical protein
MSDPRGEYGLKDFYREQGFSQLIANSDAQLAHAGGAIADLLAVTIAKGTLKTVGARLRVRAWGTFAANANAKRVNLDFGATTVADSVSSTSWNAHKWLLEADICLTGTGTTQKANGQVTGRTAAGAAATLSSDIGPTAPAEAPLTADIVLRTRGTGVAGSDVVQEGMTVELIGTTGGL